MHDLVTFVVIFLLAGLFPLCNEGNHGMIILMVTMVSAFVTILPVASMVVANLATMMPVVQVMAVSNRKMCCLLFLWLLLLLELVKDTGRFFGSLTLFEIGHKPKRVHGHHFVCFHELKLMRLRLQEKYLFAFLLR